MIDMGEIRISNLLFEKIETNDKRLDNKRNHDAAAFVKKPMTDMKFNELEALLDTLLAKDDLPSEIPYRSTSIQYQRECKLLMVLKTLYRLLKTEYTYQKYFLKKIQSLKENKEVYTAFKKTGCLKAIHMYFYLAKIGLNDLLESLGGRFNDTLFMNFTIATQLYDASFDVPECRKYLKGFETFILTGVPVESDDVVWRIFIECVQNFRQTLNKKEFDKLLRFVQIEHVSQLMSISQLSEEEISQESLRKITFSKGGIALLAIMFIMAPHMKKEERKAIYELGSVMQIVDDIRDAKEDIISGIQTLANRKLLDYTDLKHMFAGTVNNLIKQCGLNPHKRNGTLNMLCWFSFFVLEGRYRKLLKYI